jgi:ABC-type uncharacterized transport system involved in gliding motility auxiliary subunit
MMTASAKKSRFNYRAENVFFHLLLVALFAMGGWISQHHGWVWDWTETGRNSLHPSSKQLLAQLRQPLQITCFAPDNRELRKQISDIIKRYQRNSDRISLEFINPALQPKLTRELGIQVSGELYLEYAGRSENLRSLDEESISNAIQRLLQKDERWLVALKGHGERNLNGEANHDLGTFSGELMKKGYRIQSLELASALQIPSNTALLVIASPQTGFLAGERDLIREYIGQGGNLLWLTDPGESTERELLSELFGIDMLPGTVVDPNAAQLGLDNPAIALAPKYPVHPTVGDFKLLTLYPHASALEFTTTGSWQWTPLISTLPRSWNETSPLKGELSRNPELGEKSGPLNLGIAISRDTATGEQRVIVIGDGDFLSNAYLGNAGNRDLGLRLIRWLAADDSLINIPVKTATDLNLNLSPAKSAIIGLGFLVVLPLALVCCGYLIWWRRRRS